MLNKKDLVALAMATAKANRNAPVAYSYDNKNYSYDEVNQALRNELNELAGSYSLFRENKNTIFSLIEEVVAEVVPTRVINCLARVRAFTRLRKIGLSP